MHDLIIALFTVFWESEIGLYLVTMLCVLFSFILVNRACRR